MIGMLWVLGRIKYLNLRILEEVKYKVLGNGVKDRDVFK